jgi:hypothetical protein
MKFLEEYEKNCCFYFILFVVNVKLTAPGGCFLDYFFLY